jgi:hypothetical protein
MKTWLRPIVRAIDARSAPLEIFVRDDDAGWADERLAALLDLCERYACPIDLAVIPAAVGDALTGSLLDRLARGAAIGLHQHGFSHQNHEPAGRPCEFGPSRPAAAQCEDIGEGRRLLLARFGPALDPIFTPPWNRCVRATASCLRENGILAVSRDRTGDGLNVGGLLECPIDVDWFWRAKGTRLSRDAWVARVSAAIAGAVTPLGFMLHHAQMDTSELAALADLLQLFAESPRVHRRSMRAIVRGLQTSRN